MFTSMWFCFAKDKGLRNTDFANFDMRLWDEATTELKREANDIAPHAALVAQRVRMRNKIKL